MRVSVAVAAVAAVAVRRARRHRGGGAKVDGELERRRRVVVQVERARAASTLEDIAEVYLHSLRRALGPAHGTQIVIPSSHQTRKHALLTANGCQERWQARVRARGGAPL